MKKCCRIGVPQGVFCALEIFGWAVFYWMMTSLDDKHITISSVCQSFAILLSFFSDGLSRGAAAVAGNFIGSKRRDLVKKVLKSGSTLLIIFSLVTALVLIVDPIDTVKFLFLHDLPDSMQTSLQLCMVLTFIYMLFDGLRWLFSGLLVAAGDTLFLLVAGSLSVWIFLLAPVYFFVVRQNLDVEYAWGLTLLYAIIFAMIYGLRFRQGAWQQIELVEQEHSKASMPAIESGANQSQTP
jgi:MATE family multidrug resistance protein